MKPEEDIEEPSDKQVVVMEQPRHEVELHLGEQIDELQSRAHTTTACAA